MKDSHIQWTEDTWNPWHGCKKVSLGCKFCYMYRDRERMGQSPSTVLKSKTKFDYPLKEKYPLVIFTCSWSDWFIDEADEWRAEAWKIIETTQRHTYQILTKRPKRILGHLPSNWGHGYNNVWLGVSGENEELTFQRLTELLRVPAKVRFLSAEPLLEDICSPRNLALIAQLDWLIIGGESGNDTGKYRYRPMESDWAQNLINACVKLGVPVFMKQAGTYLSKKLGLADRSGGIPSEWPKELQVRQYPSYTNRAAEKVKASMVKQMNLGLNGTINSDNETPKAAKEISDLPTFSGFKAPISNINPVRLLTVDNVYKTLKSDKNKAITEQLRAMESKEEARIFKAENFHYVTFSGEFTSRREVDLVKHSSLMVLDFDDIGDVSNLREQLLADASFETVLLFTSPSGNGVKWVIQFDPIEWSHDDYFQSVSNYIFHTYGVEIDQSGRDVSRACFIGYDPDVFINNKYINASK